MKNAIADIVIIKMENAIINQKKEGYLSYVGHEFCDRMINFSVFDNNCVVLLPILGEDKIEELEKNYYKIKNNEIIVNDWGTLHLLESLGHKKITIGRWLSRKIIPDIISDARAFDIDAKRMEIDYFDLQKIVKNKELFRDFQFSYHYPYVPVTITRRCSSQNKYYGSCTECSKKIVTNKSCNIRFLLIGNTLMIKTKKPLIQSSLIDRMVYNGQTE